MSGALIVHNAGPGLSLQDLGRPGHLVFGLSRGGAADRLALAEGAALLGQDVGCAALEMVGMGGVFEATRDVRIALTGAQMRATLDDLRLAWNASHLVLRGQRLDIGASEAGVFGYLHVGGGFDTPMVLGGRGAHLAAGLGGLVQIGDHLPLGADTDHSTGLCLTPHPRFSGGLIRLLHGPQTGLFTPDQRARFEATSFRRDARGNRMGARLVPEGERFGTDAGLSILSETVVPGDIQITGDGTPFVLLSECQTTGGYPRIGTVLPSDLPKIAQTPPGAEVRFAFVSLQEAQLVEKASRTLERALPQSCRPLFRDPALMPDLLSYQLISGMTAGDDIERNEK